MPLIETIVGLVLKKQSGRVDGHTEKIADGVAVFRAIETVSADAGLGYLINDAREFLKTDVIVVGLAVYSLLGLLTDTLVRFIERKALAWRS